MNTAANRHGGRMAERAPKPGSNDWKMAQNMLPMFGKTAKPGSNVWKIAAAAFVAMISFACGNGEALWSALSESTFKADSYGIALRGGYRLDCGDGEVSALLDSDLREIIPPGVVLSVFRSGYCIGYYDGGAFFERDGERINLDRVFFIIDCLGKLSYYEPAEDDRRFYGKKIPEEVQFIE